MNSKMKSEAMAVAKAEAKRVGIKIGELLDARSRQPEATEARRQTFATLAAKLGWSGSRIAALLGFNASTVTRALRRKP